MPTIPENPNVRKGQFLWMEEESRKRYVEKLMRKVSKGYYFSEKVISNIVEELAPVFTESLDRPAG